jgi:hypothetical protein
MRLRLSDFRLRNHRSMNAFRFGLFGGSKTIVVSVFCSTYSRIARKLLSLSTIR